MEKRAREREYKLNIFKEVPESLKHHVAVAGYTTYSDEASIGVNHNHTKPGFETRQLIIHELSHNAAHTKDHAYIETMYSSNGYQGAMQKIEVYSNAGSLVKMTREKLLDNADTFAHFVENY